MIARTPGPQGVGAGIRMHRVVQYFLLHQFKEATAVSTGTGRLAFQHASDFVRVALPSPVDIRASRKEDLLQVKETLAHAVSLATKYAELHPAVLGAEADWMTLLLDCGSCAARLEDWEQTKKLLTVANDMLASLAS